LTGKLLITFKQRIKDVTLIPASGGCFEVTVNGDLIYSKLQTGKFPDEKAILDAVESRLQR